MRSIRNFLPPVYGLLILVGFLISAKVGVIVAVVGALIFSIAFTALSRQAAQEDGLDRNRAERRERRAARRRGA